MVVSLPRDDKGGGNSPSTHNSCHSRVRGPRKHEYVCGVDKAGILYPFSNNSCHSRARGPRKYECICGVDKAGIGSIKFISRITSE